MGDHPVARERVLVVGDANPDLVLRGDVVPRFGQIEQLLDAADLVIGGSAAIMAHGVGPARPSGEPARRRRRGRPGRIAARPARRRGRRHRPPVRAAGGADRGHGRALARRRARDPHLSRRDCDTDRRRGVGGHRGDPGLRHVHVASLYLHPAFVDTLAPVLAGLRVAGRTVSLDTNDDPSGSWQGMDELLPNVDVLLPNAREAIELAGLGAGADPVDAARALAGRGPLVVVKLGAQGAVAAAHDGTVDHGRRGRGTGRSTRPAQATPSTPRSSTPGWPAPSWPPAWPAPSGPGRMRSAAVGGTAGQPTASELDTSTTTGR